MTKIETLVKLIDQSSINCHGVDCRECPFDGLPGGRSECALLHLNDANAEGIAIKKAIIDAVDEARKEEPDPKTGEWWRSKGDDRYIVKIVDGYCRLLKKLEDMKLKSEGYTAAAWDSCIDSVKTVIRDM